MNKWSELFIGLILVVGTIFLAWLSGPGQGWGAFDFWSPAWAVLKGGIFWFVIGIGLILLLLGISELRE